GSSPRPAAAVRRAPRGGGGDPPRLPAPSDTPALAERLRGDPALAAYGGVVADWHATLDVDADLLGHMAEQGLVRAGAGGRGLALVRQWARRQLPGTFLGGAGAAGQDLLPGLRCQAESLDMGGVAVLAPVEHPAAEDLSEAGYDVTEGEGHAYVYALDL